MPIGCPRGQGPSGIDYDHPATLSLSLSQERHEMGGSAGRIVPPNYCQPAVNDIGVRLTPTFAQRGFDGLLRRRSANTSLELAGSEPVPETGARHGHLNQAQRPTIAVGQDRFRPILGRNALPAASNFRNSVRPRHWLPLAASLGTNTPQRIKQTVWMVDMVEIRPHFRAEPAFSNRVI